MYYFEKIANELSKKDSSKKELAGHAGVIGGSLVGNKALGVNLKRLADKENQKLTDSEILDLARQKSKEIGFKDKDAIEVRRVNNIDSDAYAGGYYRPDVRVGDNEFIVRHELGHVKDLTKKRSKIHDKTQKQKGDYMRHINAQIEREKLTDDVRETYSKLNDAVNDNSVDPDTFKSLRAKYDKKLSRLEHLDNSINGEHSIFINNKNIESEINRNRARLGKGLTSSLHSKTVRDSIRKANNGKSKTVDKVMNTMDNPVASAAILGTINNSALLKKELAASLDATKGMVSKYGRKKGLAMSLPMFATQMGSYITKSTLNEGLKGGVIRGAETLGSGVAKKVKQKQVEKKASYKELIYKESEMTRDDNY